MKLFSLMICIIGVYLSNNKSESQCLIVPGKGLNNIVVGKSTLEDVQRLFEKKDVQKKWHPPIEMELLGRYEYYIEYPNIGTFSTYSIKNSNNEIIKTIKLTAKCDCKTADGLGIESSYNEVIKEMGRPKQWYYFQLDNQDKGYKTKLIYNNMDIMLDGKDSTNNKIFQIEIYDNN